MSLAARARFKGSTVTLYRATKARTAGGSTNLTYAANITGFKVLLDVPDSETVQRLFGQDVRCDLRAFVPKPCDIAEKDGLTVTAGWRVGEHYDVAGIMDFDQGRRNAHYEVALVRRPEAFL